MCKDFISKILHRASKQDLECDDIYNHVTDVRARSSKCPRICFPVILVELKSIQLHVCNLSPLPPQHRIPKQERHIWLEPCQAAAAPGSDLSPRPTKSCAWERCLCQAALHRREPNKPELRNLLNAYPFLFSNYLWIHIIMEWDGQSPNESAGNRHPATSSIGSNETWSNHRSRKRGRA